MPDDRDDLSDGPPFRALNAAMRDTGPGKKKKPATDTTALKGRIYDSDQAKQNAVDIIGDPRASEWYGTKSNDEIRGDAGRQRYAEAALNAAQRDTLARARAGTRNPDEQTAALVHHLLRMQGGQ